MNFIDLNAVTVRSNRQRTAHDEGAIRELAESIQSLGLLHPIVLREEGEDMVLVAGERRLTACRDLYLLGGKFKYNGEPVVPGMIPYTNLRDLSPLEAMEAEYEENVRRLDLSWQDKTRATDGLAALRRAQAAATGVPAPTTAEIAAEIRSSSRADIEDTRLELALAKHMDDPDIARAGTLREAFKIAARKEVAAKMAEHGEKVGRTFTSSLHRLYNEDCLEWMKKQGNEQFDVILADPPYGMGADKFGDSRGLAAGAHSYADSVSHWRELMNPVTREIFRLAKQDAHAYLFCDIDNFVELRFLMHEAGWRVFRTPLIWHKPTAVRAPWPEHGPQRKWEMILYAMKGDRRVNKLQPDLVTYMPEENLGHSAQKPIALFADLLARSVRPGDSVFDPFAGTGPIFPAAHQLKCTAVGVEMDKASYGIAARRIEALK